MGENAKLILITIAACIVLFFLFYLASRLSRVQKKRDILDRMNPGPSETARLLRLSFGKHNVIRGVYLPMYDGKNVSSYIFADTIVILPTCIAVCRIRSEAGLIYCEDGFDWHQSARLRSGGTLESDFTNPMGMNREAVTALRRIFDRTQIEEPPIHGMIIFASRSVRFSCSQPNVFGLEDGYNMMKTLCRGEKIPKSSREAYRKLILTYTVRKSVAEGYNVKKLT